MSEAEALESLVAAVQESAKYRSVSPDLIRALGRKQLAVERNLKAAIKATKNKLHQVTGAYRDEKPRYADWLAALTAAKA